MEPTAGGKLKYEVFGPFPFQVSGNVAHREALKQFWSARAKDSPEGLSGAIGVYVWTTKQDGRRLPWNVGLTERQGFSKRFVQKENGFLRLLRDQPNSEIDVYLLALRYKTGKFRRPTKSVSARISANHWLETMLIGSAISANPNLRNKAKVKYLRNAVVEGYLNDKEDERSKAAKSFNAMFKAQPRERK
jgi:hypothetical protein